MAAHFRDFNIASEWHFSATGHGKGLCDSTSATVKRSARVHSLKSNNYILTPAELFNFCQKKLASKTLKFFYVPETVITSINGTEEMIMRYNQARRVQGTRLFHSVVPKTTSGAVLELRLFSSAQDFVTHAVGVIDVPPLQISVGRHIAVCINKKWQIGQIILKDINEPINDNVCVSFFTRVSVGNKLKPPSVERKLYVAYG